MPSTLPCDIHLWDFSLHQYSRAGVSEICIALQDEQGINVNLLLWSLWLGHRRLQLTDGLLAQAIDDVRLWDANYVVPLRQMRRRLKAEFGTGNPELETVRAHIKQAELLAEKHLQALLQGVVHEGINIQKHLLSRRELMGKNLECYLVSCGVSEHQAEELMRLVD